MSNWQPIETAPKDKTVILRPHVMYGPMSVRYIPEGIRCIGGVYHWVSSCYTPAWPDDAFAPYWMKSPEPPTLTTMRIPIRGVDEQNSISPDLTTTPIPAPSALRPAGSSAEDSDSFSGEAMTHELKCWPEFFRAVRCWEKMFEIRHNDRNFKVGDILYLREWHPGMAIYTGAAISRRITYMTDFPTGLREGYICMGLGSVSPATAPASEPQTSRDATPSADSIEGEGR